MNEMKRTNELIGKTTVFLTHPAIQTDYSCSRLRNVPFVEVNKTSFHSFRSKVKSDNPDILETSIAKSYALQLKACLCGCEQLQMVSQKGDRMAYIVLGHASPAILEAVAEFNVPYTYVYPTDTKPAEEFIRRQIETHARRGDSFIVEALKMRLEEVLSAAQYDFALEIAKQSAERVLQVETSYMYDVDSKMDVDTTMYRYICTTNGLDRKQFLAQRLNQHSISSLASAMHLMMDKFTRSKWCYLKPAEDGTRDWGYHRGKYRNQMAVDTYGRLVHIISREDPMRLNNKIFGGILPMEDAARMGCVGLDSYVIEKKFIDRLMEYLTHPDVRSAMLDVVNTIEKDGDKSLLYNDLVTITNHLEDIQFGNIRPISQAIINMKVAAKVGKDQPAEEPVEQTAEEDA